MMFQSDSNIITSLLLLLVPAVQDEALDGLLKGAGKAEVEFLQLDARTGDDPKGLHGWTVLGKTPMKGEAADGLRKVLADAGTWTKVGAKCFEPGMGLRFRGGEKDFDLVICLKCRWVHVHAGGERVQAKALAEAGRDALLRIYKEQTAIMGK